jgi:hypothetical protein
MPAPVRKDRSFFFGKLRNLKKITHFKIAKE